MQRGFMLGLKKDHTKPYLLANVGSANPMKTPKLPCDPFANIASPAADNRIFCSSEEVAKYLLLKSSIVSAVLPVTKIVVPIRNKIRESRADDLLVSLCAA